MAYEMPVHSIPLPAGEDLSAKQFHAMRIDTDGEVVTCDNSYYPIGILQNNPAVDDYEANVMVLGVSKAMYGDTVIAGQSLMSDASGHMVPATSTHYVVGVALEGGSSTEVHSVEIAAKGYVGNAVSPQVVDFHLKLADVATTGNLASFTPRYVGSIKSIQSAVVSPSTSGDAGNKSKSIVLGMKIATTAVTGGEITIASNAGGTDMILDREDDGTTVTALNVFGATDKIHVYAKTVTAAFKDGDVDVHVLLY